MEKLSIPERISLEKEVAPNLRSKDLPKLFGMVIPGIVITVIVWICASDAPLTQLIALIIGFLYMGLCYALVAKIDGSLSVIEHLGRTLRFYRNQQIYYFKHEKEVVYHVQSGQSGTADGTGVH